MKMVNLSEGLSLSAVVQGFWRLGDWKWTTEELVRFMNLCIERGVTSLIQRRFIQERCVKSRWERLLRRIKQSGKRSS